MKFTLPRMTGEWEVGWRIVAACAIANGTGVALVFYTFSMFLLPLADELKLTRAETGLIQSLVLTAALGAPLVGRLTDLLGFRTVYVFCTGVLGLTAILQGTLVHTWQMLAVTVGVSAFLGSGASAITLTRPINAHFRRYRGRALGLVGAGVSVTTMIVPPFLQHIIASYGWRAGFVGLAGISLGIGLPLVLLLMPKSAATARIDRHLASSRADWSFLRLRDFWLLCLANIVIALAASGAVSQLSPMIQAERLSAATAALGLSFFAAGQLIGKLGGGWLLDRFEPRRIAAAMIMVPASGFLILLSGDGQVLATLLAVMMIGLLHGADVDIFAFFTARRFGFERYGTVFGVLHGLGWFGTVGGILVFGSSFDRFGSYAPAQSLALVALALGAIMLLPVRLPAAKAD